MELPILLAREDFDQFTKARRLTPKEAQVLWLLMHGAGNPSIAREAKLTVQTVKNLIARVWDKVGGFDERGSRLYLYHIVLTNIITTIPLRPPKFHDHLYDEYLIHRDKFIRYLEAKARYQSNIS